MFDPIQYATLKEAGAIVSAAKDESGLITVVFKTFCPQTGAQLENQTWVGTLDSVNASIAAYEGQTAQLQALAADVS